MHPACIHGGMVALTAGVDLASPTSLRQGPAVSGPRNSKQRRETPMIIWPRDESLPADARDALERFRASGASAALEEEPHTWRVMTWPWSDELPLRIVLENETHEEVIFTLRGGGLWQLERMPLAVHGRSEEALATDARAEVF
jgi:hypothetical protein